MKILWVKCDFLHPTTRGGQIRSLEILKRLHARHEVHYIAYENPDQPEGMLRAHEYSTYAYPVRRNIPPRASLAFALQVRRQSLLVDAARARSLSVRSTAQPDHCDTKSESVRSRGLRLLSPTPNFPRLNDCVLFQHNVETVIWRRHSENAPDPLRKLYFKLQAQRMFRWEKRMCLAAAEVIAVSPQDAALMRDRFGVTRVSCIPTGVDIHYFRRPDLVPAQADLVFLGSMDWLPNIDGVKYFVREILPLIRRRLPECTLAIVGRAPSAATLAFAKRDPRIRVTGTVADVRPWLWGSKVSIVPLRIGGGTRLKIYESMAAGTATVSTSIGAEGLEVSHPANIRIADTRSAFAEQCIDLLEDARERARLESEGLELVKTRFSWDVVVAEFERVLTAARDRNCGPALNSGPPLSISSSSAN